MSILPFDRNVNFFSLLAAHTILGAAMPMLIILGGLAGLMLAPTMGLATLPASVQTLAGLLMAGVFSIVMGRFGRRAGFVAGAGLAILGGLLGGWAVMRGHFLLLCVAHFALGAALSCYQYFRFAAAEAVSRAWQPVAISLMLTSGLVAAFVGPQLFIATTDAVAPIPFAGAYFAISALSLVGLLPLLGLRMPVPVVPRKFDGSLSVVLQNRPVRTAIGVGAVSQGIMVFLMIPTPIAMIGCGFTDIAAGDVIRWHVVAMFAPSFVTGFLIKRFGVKNIMIIGFVFLVMAASIAALGVTIVHFYASLILLGVGWNFGFIGATTMLASAVPAAQKAIAQGVNDTVIALVSTVCAFSAGAIMAGFGWVILAVIALIVLIIALIVIAAEKAQ